MKTKYIFIFYIVGSLLKVFYGFYNFSNPSIAIYFQFISSLILIIFWLLIIWKAVTHPALRDFMNK
jgi:hypothetical protein